MPKDNTLLILGGLGIAGYLVYRSNLAKSVGDIGEGLGNAVGGLGAGISDIGQEAGDIFGDVGSILEPLASFSNSQANLIEQLFRNTTDDLQREQRQDSLVDNASFAQAFPSLVENQTETEVFASGQQRERSSLRQRALTGVTQIFSTPVIAYGNLAENFASRFQASAPEVLSSATQRLRATASSIASAIRERTLRSSSGSVSSSSSSSSSSGGSGGGSVSSSSSSALGRATSTAVGVATRVSAVQRILRQSLLSRLLRRFRR